MATSVEVEGAIQMEASLHRAAEKVQDMTAANREVAQLAAQAAKPPRRTGRLAGSIRPIGEPTEAVVEVAQPYAGVIENGWAGHNIAPTHFLRDAFAAIQPAAMDIYEKAGKAVLDDVKGA